MVAGSESLPRRNDKLQSRPRPPISILLPQVTRSTHGPAAFAGTDWHPLAVGTSGLQV